MARHASLPTPAARRALVVLVSAGIAVGAGAATAAADGLSAAPGPHHRPVDTGRIDPEAGLRGTLGSARYATGAVQGLKPNPLAGTGVDPLDNGVSTRISDFRPLESKALTGPVAQAPSLGAVPVLGQAMGLLG
ncbi:hypothetical protein ACFOOM_05910 [Streptomyces echinoruber]|uniref:ATP-binding protein n=1 Tax=Streptomyces echinoruber TaxID=68898 RepID=A0A918RSC9_9ACTN|nr:hypothetical protein [Streptomyces echinoruber]GHA08807.1 hypothetical protein GCM10010389_54950 [Streptomyces echinoruber]